MEAISYSGCDVTSKRAWIIIIDSSDPANIQFFFLEKEKEKKYISEPATGQSKWKNQTEIHLALHITKSVPKNRILQNKNKK